ncbi:MAG: ATP-binding protein [Myxococcales bacterium]
MPKALRALQTYGVEQAAEQGLGKQILMTNSLTLVGAALYLSGLVYLLGPAPWILYLDLFALLAHLLLPFLNRWRLFFTSRVTLVLLANGVMSVAAAAEGPGSGIQYLLFPLAPLPLVLFTLDSRREIAAMVSCVAMSVAAFFALDLINDRGLMPDAMRLATSRVMYVDSVFSTFVVSLSVTFYLLVSYRRAERQLVAQQGQLLASAKLAALGEMAGGVAHEINNPLGILSLLSSRLALMARSERFDRASATKLCTEIEGNLARVAGIVKNLQAFARDGSRDPPVCADLSELIEAALGFCRERCLSHGVALSIAPLDRYVGIQCRPGDVTQILLNLLNNAREAAEKQPGGERWIDLSVSDSAEGVDVRVSNGGPLLPHHQRARLFDPFFTTKPVGRGTGMGLSVALGLAQAHGGTLLLDESAPNTCFVLHLPTHAAPR